MKQLMHLPLLCLSTAVLILSLLCPNPCPADDLFQEGFDDNGFSNRGWYGVMGLILSTTEKHSGNACAEFKYLAGNPRPNSSTGASIMARHKFNPTQSVYVSYYVKYSASWQITDPNPIHHELYLLTNKDGDFSGIRPTHLAVQDMLIQGRPFIAISDESNIDKNHINEDLSGVTEYRAVAGCNGSSDSYPEGFCYGWEDEYINQKKWQADFVYQTAPGTYYLNAWHHIEVFVKLNGISNNKGQPDGVIQFWVDGQQKMDLQNVVLRTAQHPDMVFNQFIIAPYISGGALQEQTMWLDELKVGNARPGDNPDLSPPSPPKNIKIIN